MKKTSTFLVLLTVLVLIVVANRAYQYYVKQNFLLLVNAICDPATEDCFVMDCAVDELGCDTTPYKKVEILAALAPKCLEEHSCEQFSCNDLKPCSVTYCSADTTEEGEKCSSDQ